ncbi:hypothetical protein Syun_027961 [Stephania yunnanensis]|uniref:Uncharacterized protein n=1 Tax=Stephania yunnanensis TaxID=152371 RepID=A0AAP0EIZ3_9MAGN
MDEKFRGEGFNMGSNVDRWSGLSSSSLQTHFIRNAEDPCRRIVAEDPPPSSSTAIVDVDRDSPAHSFIGNPRRPRVAARPCPIELVGRRRCRYAVFSSGVAAAKWSSPPAPLFAAAAAPFFESPPLPPSLDPPPLAINKAPRPRDPPTPRPPVTPTLVASASSRRRCWTRSAAARRSRDPPPPLALLRPTLLMTIGRLGSSLTEFRVSSATRGLPLD